MNKAREAATKEVVKWLSKFAGKNESVKTIETMLNELSDKAFDSYMQKLRDGEETLPYIAANLGDVRISVEKNFEIADEIGHQFLQQLWLTDPATGETHLTPEEYLVVDLPLKRLKQHVSKKIQIPSDNQHIDEMTGQPAGPSKGSGVSFPELQAMYSQDLEETLREFFKFRGGDEKAYRQLVQDAGAGALPSMSAVDDGTTRPRSTEVLNIFLKAAHLDNNL